MVEMAAAVIAKSLNIPTISVVKVIGSKGSGSRGTKIVLPGGTLTDSWFQKDTLSGLAEPFGKTTKVHSIPATRYAEELGKKVVANIIMLGFFTAISGKISPEAMIKSIRSSTPSGYEELNVKAFQRGYESGLTKTKKKP